ncbi:MAG: Planctomycete cytochrome, partial [Phycisphaerales bacterium]|nr:Planctomycete cytochrome [Phycisphaerales bacterium]
RPLLAENCFSCHGEKKQKGRLRLDSAAGLLKGGAGGPAVVAGDPGKSPLLTAVGYADPDLQMPPDEKLSDAQVKVLTDWVAMGAPWPADPAGGRVAAASGAGGLVGKKRTIKDADRQFWSFRPVTDPPPPAVADPAYWCRNDVDRFVLAKLAAEGLTPAAEADRAALVRRVTFDLHGLPPTPAEVDAFVADDAPDAYEKLVDRLLASPRYGERYARLWMDLVRYAESDGFRQDAFRANAYPYRDWLVAAFNADMPYDRFVREQLAGDEVAPGDLKALVATGYLRAGSYEFNQKDAEQQWSEYLNDLTDVTADAFLGLSLGCARCHDHKFDPVLQVDYFKLRAFFAPVLPRDDLPLDGPAAAAAHAAEVAAWEARTADLRARIAEIEAPHLRALEVDTVGRFPPAVQAMVAKPAADRSPYERQIVRLVYLQVKAEHDTKLDGRLKGEAKEKLAALRKELAAAGASPAGARPKALLTTLCATDVGPVAPPTRVPGTGPEARVIEPGYPVVLDGLNVPTPPPAATATSTGRRTALANWLTDKANPLPARVITNRLWQWHFGQGLVRTSSDYGKLGEPPTHPELLDHLTTKLLNGGWSLKAVHRVILTSATYRQSAARPMPAVAKLKDPDNRWLWRMNPRRLDAEQVRDAMLAAGGELELSPAAGPSTDYTAQRRAVFTKWLRNTRDPLMDAFDLAEAFGSVANRNVTTTATQSLLMVKGDWPLKRAAALARRAAAEAGSTDTAAVIDRAYRLAYGRPPESDERYAAVAFLAKSREAVAAATTVASATPAGQGAPTTQPAPAAATATVASASDAQPTTQLMPQTGGQALLVRNGNPADALVLQPGGDGGGAGSTGGTACPLGDGGPFTVEAYVLPESVYDSASVRVIASRWDGDPTHAGWSVGVTGDRSAYGPGNLILQWSAGAAGKYEVVASDLKLSPHNVYYVAVAVNPADPTEAGVRFWLKDVGDTDAGVLTARVKHALTAPIVTSAPLVIGGRSRGPGGKPPHGWDGLIGEVRLSRAALTPGQLLISDGDPKAAVAGHWRFEDAPGPLKEDAGRLPDLARGGGDGRAAGGKATGKVAKGGDAQRRGAAAGTGMVALPAVDAALVDLCHALLNSNEFLYVD